MGINVILKSKNPLRLVFTNFSLIYKRLSYKFKFKKLGKQLKVHGTIITYSPENIIVGAYVSLNEGVILNASRSKIIIGDYCTISANSQLHTTGLTVNKKYKERIHIAEPIILKEGVWLCAGVIVNPGVTIGKGSIIAPGSVVTKNIPSFELWGGVPAKKIKDIK